MTVRTTRLAEAQIAGLRGVHKNAYNVFEEDLDSRGCAALGYRLTGDLLDRLCVKHLRASMRVVVVFDVDGPVVLLVAFHAGPTKDDVY